MVAGLNPRPSVSLRLFTWQTPSQPLGVWIAALSLGGAALSGGATALALRQASPSLRRRLRRDAGPDWGVDRDGAGRSAAERETAGRAWTREPFPGSGGEGSPEPVLRQRQPDPQSPSWEGARGTSNDSATAGPSRAPGEPPPTVSVPYRVIRRADGGRTGSAAVGSEATVRGATVSAPAEREPVPIEDDWQASSYEEW